MIVDRLKDRLALAESIGAIPIDDSKESPVDQILEFADGDELIKDANAWAIKPTIRKDMNIPTLR